MRFRKPAVLYALISLIGLLLLANIFLLVVNSKTINANKDAQENATRVKIKTQEIITNVHVLDLGLRGHALSEDPQIKSSLGAAFAMKDTIFLTLELALMSQEFPMQKFYSLRDSINNYFAIVANIETMINEGRRQEFMDMINKDLGYDVWLFHKQFANEVNAFEDRIASEAKRNFERAVRNSYLLQAVLFLIIMPTLLYLAYYTNRSFRLSNQLLRSEAEKNALLFNQNETLERTVTERTSEILTQNEEILSQNEEISTHNEQLIAQQKEIEHQQMLLSQRNEQLQEASQTISHQKLLIEQRNRELTSEVAQQNRDLIATNHELVLKNNRIEQFAYIISHNLRAPIARLLGLTSILKLAKSPEESKQILGETTAAAAELDQMVKDLSGILAIQRLSAAVFKEIDFALAVEKAQRILQKEISDTETGFDVVLGVKSFYSLPPYIDNILYNLISNAIKYRDPERKPKVKIQNAGADGLIHITIADNGLGMDLQSHGDKLFSLYKRFHFHVEGRGLGLYLVKTQIEMLGGTIAVESEPYAGTTFKIVLPNRR